MLWSKSLGHEDFDQLSDEFFAAVAEKFLCAAIDQGDPSLAINHHHCAGSGFEDDAKTFLLPLAK